MLDLSVIVPARNAERILGDCLASLVRAEPREILVVDGLSTDRTIEIAESYPVRILSDDGKGLPAARLIGVYAAQCDLIALVDADVVIPDGALARLLEEYRAERYTALQAGLHSVSGAGYWGRALANHHRSGRSKDWFGVVATIIDRATLLEHGFDEDFLSGEDMELRWRLREAGAKLGVSRDVIVEHRFEDTFDFARGQWLADGHGLGRLIRKQGWKAVPHFGLPAAAAVRGIGLSVFRREPAWIPYYACYAAYNYVGLLAELVQRRSRGSEREPAGVS